MSCRPQVGPILSILTPPTFPHTFPQQLPDYEQEGEGQRCAQQGVLQTPLAPATQEQCWRLCSNLGGVQQPNTY